MKINVEIFKMRTIRINRPYANKYREENLQMINEGKFGRGSESERLQ